MVHTKSWLVLGCLGISLMGCGGGEAEPAAANNAAAPAPGAAPPGMGPADKAGGGAMAGGPGAQAPAPAGPTVVVPKDPLVYLPAKVTFAVGGLPAAVLKSSNKAAASFLSQFAPLTIALTRVGLPPNQIESFWAAANADFTEQAMCVITTVDINQEVLRQALGGEKIPKESRVWPLPGDAAVTHALAVADSRTIIIGRKPTVESALRKSPALLIKQGLGTINHADSDFWMAGDSAAAEAYFKGGLPLLGRYRQPFEELKAFGIGMILDGKAVEAKVAVGAANDPGMLGPRGMPAGADTKSAGPGGLPGGTVNASVVPAGDQFGVTVMGGFLFESDAAATKAKLPLDQFLATSARQRVGPSGRYIPDLLGIAGTDAGPRAGADAGPRAGAAGGAGPRAGAAGGEPGPRGAAGGSTSQSNLEGQVGVIPEPANARALPTIDYRLHPVAPPAPQVVVVATAGAATPDQPVAADPANSVPGGVPAGAAFAEKRPDGAIGAAFAEKRPGDLARPEMLGAGGPGGSSVGGQWAHQQAGFIQFAYHFEARDENLAFAVHLLHALGTTPFGDPLSAGPLASIHKALPEARGPANAAGTSVGFGSRGTSWMINLLPFMGHQALYKRLNSKFPLIHPENAKLTHAVIPEFLNPADPRQQWSGIPYADMGLTHFVGLSGVEDEGGPLAATLDRSDPRAGIFGYRQIATPEMITDGLSQTIMVVGSGVLASPWAVGGGATIRGARPNSFAPISGFGSAGGPKAGAFVLLADGSVRFVSADIDQQVFNALGTTHGKDTVDLPALQGAGTVVGK